METKAKELGMGGELLYLFPSGGHTDQSPSLAYALQEMMMDHFINFPVFIHHFINFPVLERFTAHNWVKF